MITPDIAAYNDFVADRYDALTQGSWLVNDLVVQALPADFGNGPDAGLKVLDLGCGTGQTISAITENTSVSQIVAVDASRMMLRNLRRKHLSPKIETVNSTIEEFVPNCQEDYDLVTAIGSLEFVRDLPTVLGQLALCIRPKGRLMATYVQRMGTDEAERTFQLPSVGRAFTEYYWEQEVINETLESSGLVLDRDLQIPAYVRGDETVNYTFISAAKSV
jgi:ubiquinone/menaquinone biosynthesis C-methylase UbiE